jgi:cobalt/nickel transport system ATP-binding protein
MTRAVSIENLSFSYPDGQPALKGISLTIDAGETVALVGPNGAGKSTLLLHLNGILRGEGSVAILGQELADHNLKWARSKVGLIFQNPDDQLFSPSVFDDVAFGPLNTGYPETEVRQRVELSLRSVGMEGSENRSPHHLSIGEKKRIAIATVLSMDPEILVLDEPTSSLDPRTKWSLIALLKDLPLTKLVATHDMELVASLCSRTVIMEKGRIAADGFTVDILADIGLLETHGLTPSKSAAPHWPNRA